LFNDLEEEFAIVVKKKPVAFGGNKAGKGSNAIDGLSKPSKAAEVRIVIWSNCCWFLVS
jgi:hypothetical protein